MTSGDFPSVNVLGIKIAALNLDSAVELIHSWLHGEGESRYVCVTGVHGVMEGYRDPEIRSAHNQATACVPDGMPMTWVGRLHGHHEMDRVYGPDLLLRMLELSAANGFRNFFYGGAPGVADELRDRMVKRFPGLEVVGTYCPPFRRLTDEEKQEVLDTINKQTPDLLWVCLSTPKQELFMTEFAGKIRSKVMLGVGAAIDFHTGRVPQAPRWVMRSGFEWLFRLWHEPRRLGPRYLRNNPSFLWHIFLQQTGLRRYPLE